MQVGCAQCCNVIFAGLAGINEILAPPTETFSAKGNQHQISGEPGMTAVAIGVRVNPNQPVMKPGCILIRFISTVLDPVAAIINELSQLLRNTLSIDANILPRSAVLTSPTPYIAEHALVQLVQKPLIKDIAFSAEGPELRFNNIGLLGFVELAASRDVGKN